nr:DUF1573 domain-containing protein [Saprospiraceae bacterium]
MKLIFSFLLTFSLGLGLLSAQDNADSTETSGPEITFESTTIDYGTIERGANGVRVFKFTNTGTEPLIITNTRGSCGCTVPKHPKDPILPGQTEEIEVKYDTNRLGKINKSVTVSTNAGNPVRLQIKGEVTKSSE